MNRRGGEATAGGQPSCASGSGRRGWRGRGRGWWWRGGGHRGRGSAGGAASANGGGRQGWQRKARESSVSLEGHARSQPHLVQKTLSNCPYSSWSKYFPDQAYSEESTTAKQVRAFQSYFTQSLTEVSLGDVASNWFLPVDATALLQDTHLALTLPDLTDQISNQPEATLNSMSLALHMVVLHSSLAQGPGISAEGDETETQGRDVDRSNTVPSPLVDEDIPRFYIRLYNFGSIIPLKNIKAPLYGKCVSIQGTVVRVSNIKPLVTAMAFRCTLCHEVQTVILPDGKYTIPTKFSVQCLNVDHCKGKVFLPLRSSPLTETVDWQTIKVQELSGGNQREAGRIPRTIECEMTSDLVDSCVPGDMVTITAVVKATSSDGAYCGRNAKDKCMFLLYLQAISVSNNKGAGSEASHNLHMEFTTKDYYAISEIHSDKNIFKLIVGSLCPTIYGHEMVKAGLVLALFGGSQRYVDQQNTIPIRGDPHVLVVGDPGLGKSQMLQAASNVAPRGVYVCGNTTTTSGLTVTLSKEGGTGDYALEAGALILADQGCCCIDEFDKMGNQHQALLEAMEQQSISIAKAGVVCNLPARTSILAAANPTGGHYNKAKTVSENLKMSGALLSRFDLVFILLDRPDEEMDCLLSEHVMSLHAGGGRGNGQRGLRACEAQGGGSGSHPGSSRGGGILRATARRSEDGGINTSLEQSSSLLLLGEETDALQKRLKVRPRENFDPVPSQLLRKYIGYARKYVHPRLGDEAADVLQKFYLDLRKQRHSSDSTPITTRQLESLIRLTEARARLELREEATGEDARDVVEILKFSMNDTFSDQYGMLDFNRSQHGSGMSQRAQGKRFISELNRVADRNGCSTFTVQQMRDIAKRIGLQVENFDDFIYSLNNQNYLLKKGPKLYQLQTASCL